MLKSCNFKDQLKIKPSRMFKILKLSTFCILSLAMLSMSFPFNDLWKEKVNSILVPALERGETLEMMIVFESKIDLQKANRLKNKDAKGNYVFTELKRVTRNDQQSVWNLLNEEKVEFRSFALTNSLLLKGDLDLVQQLSEFSTVKRIINNPTVQLDAAMNETEAGSRGPDAVEWGIAMIGADQVWNMGYRGEGVTVAGEDTGYDWQHPALINSYRGYDGTAADHNYNWHDAIHEISPLHEDVNPTPELNPCGLESGEPCDDNNHGTHTMGTMVGEDGENQIGVAPGAKWMACRNMERGYGSPATYIECFEFFLAPTDLNGENADPTKAPHVINNSWSCPQMEGCNPDNWDLMETAVNNLKAAGVVVVASAGNSGSGCETVSTPAAMFLNSFTIGSTTSADEISGFSSRGPVTVDGSGRMKPNVTAPGSQVRSCVREGGYSTFSGTSMAGPHVAGAVALIISANPELAGQVETIEGILETTAVAKTTDQICGGVAGTEIPNHTFGFGRIDALAAVELALSLIVDVEETVLDKQIKVFPNPVQDRLSFDFGSLRGKATLNIYDYQGKLLVQNNIEMSEVINLDLKGLNSGLYIYEIEANGIFTKGKFFKK